ncbi:MAG: TetR/AcrR family transcriptional regulator [Gemmataceae bacterium]
MKPASKLSGEERRAAIIHAVRRAFADKGFHGTTTRELAAAAGVSEALLFKHFPNKEALYSAMLLSCSKEDNAGKADRLAALEPSTSTLAVMVHVLFSHVLGRKPGDDDDSVSARLMLRSMAEDGEFARLILSRLATTWVPRVEACLEAAITAGDAVAGPIPLNLRGRFVHQFAASVMFHLLPAACVVDYGLSREELVEQSVWFALRGMGVKEEAIRRVYNPKAWALCTG